jgi:hypothetical protein
MACHVPVDHPVKLESATVKQHLLQPLAPAQPALLRVGERNSEPVGQFLVSESFKLREARARRDTAPVAQQIIRRNAAFSGTGEVVKILP